MIKSTLTAGLLAVALGASAQAYVENRAHYSTNPDGKVGQRATITIDGEFTDWNESMVIATGGANDICTAFKGAHENCVLDMYALLAAWDDTNLYLGWQMCNTGDTWAREGDGPLTDYGRIGDVPLAVCLSVNPNNVSMTGLNAYGKGLWGDKANMGYGFEGDAAHVDHWLLMSGKAGQGEPAMFTAVDAQGNSNYAEGCYLFKTNGIQYKMKEGFMFSSLWRQMSYADFDASGALLSDPDMINNIYDEEHYVDILSDYYKNEYRAAHNMKIHDTKYDSFYEIKIPLASLGITADYLETYGICARVVATRGESAIDCLPFDPSMVDNVWDSYNADKSTSHEKDDFDKITYQAASIGKIRNENVEYPDPDPNPGPNPNPNPNPTPDPTPTIDGNWIVYLDNTSSWSNPMTWIWDAGNGNVNFTGGTWPGAKMKTITIEGTQYYYYDFQADNLIKPMVIFSNGGSPQTKDLDLVNKAVYNCDGYVVGSIDNPLTAVDSIEDLGAEAPVEYYNLQGIRVINPGRGAYILRQGSKVSKVFIQ